MRRATGKVGYTGLTVMAFCALALQCVSGDVHADDGAQDPLQSIAVLALGALDGRAVVKSADGKMHVLKLGDALPGTKAVVTQILADKLVVEDAVDGEGTPIHQTVWIKKSAGGGQSVVQRFNRDAPPSPLVALDEAAVAGTSKATVKPKKK